MSDHERSKNDTCDRCGATKDQPKWAVRPICLDCYSVLLMVDRSESFHNEEAFTLWLERVIDRRVQKALAERRLP